jgi:hypothetical protein
VPKSRQRPAARSDSTCGEIIVAVAAQRQQSTDSERSCEGHPRKTTSKTVLPERLYVRVQQPVSPRLCDTPPRCYARLDQ